MSGEHTRPFLTLQIGQAGAQIGNAIWELLCLEHNILPNGKAKPDCPSNGYYDAMFISNDNGHFLPRTIFVDTDPSCIDEIRIGPYKDLFSSGQLMTDQYDTKFNYMNGRHGFLQHLVPDTAERFRWLAEKTDLMPAVFLVHSVGGGTGSGLATSCLEALKDDFGDSLQVLEFNVSSGSTGLQSSCELLNSTLYQFESRSLTDVSFNVTNSALYNICRSGLERQDATFAHVNRILAMTFSNLTAMERFPAIMPCNLAAICSNLLPFRQMKTPILACAPFATSNGADSERLTAVGVTSYVMEPDSQLADTDLRQGKHMAGVLLYRGAAKPTDLDQAVAVLRTKGRSEFVNWTPASFRTGLLELPPLAVPESGIGSPSLSVTLVSNNTSVAALFRGKSEAIKKLLATDGCFVGAYENAFGNRGGGGGEGTSGGHNSAKPEVKSMLLDACDYMDGMAEMYSSDMPPDRFLEKQADKQKQSQSDSKPGSSTGDQGKSGARGSKSDSLRQSMSDADKEGNSTSGGKRVRDEESQPASKDKKENEVDSATAKSKAAGRTPDGVQDGSDEASQRPESGEEDADEKNATDSAAAPVTSTGNEQPGESSVAEISDSEAAGMGKPTTESTTAAQGSQGVPASLSEGQGESQMDTQDKTQGGRPTALTTKGTESEGKPKRKKKSGCCGGKKSEASEEKEESADGTRGRQGSRAQFETDSPVTAHNARSLSQNHANSYRSFLSSESLRSNSFVNLLGLYGTPNCGRSSPVSFTEDSAGLSTVERDCSTESTPIGESAVGVAQIIRECKPGPLPAVTNVQKMIQRYEVFSNRRGGSSDK